MSPKTAGHGLKRSRRKSAGVSRARVVPLHNIIPRHDRCGMQSLRESRIVGGRRIVDSGRGGDSVPVVAGTTVCERERNVCDVGGRQRVRARRKLCRHIHAHTQTRAHTQHIHTHTCDGERKRRRVVGAMMTGGGYCQQ